MAEAEREAFDGQNEEGHGELNGVFSPVIMRKD